VTVAALLIRAWRYREPPSYVFDEVYYVPDALAYLDGGAETTWVHPPLGKWLIAAGIRVLGDTPSGWRIASLVFGGLVVLLTYLLALRLLGSCGWAAIASALVAADGLQIVQSRIATLDVFVATFIVAGVLLVHIYARPSSAEHEPRPVWLAASGVMFGAALAVKWAALPVLAFAAVAVVAASANRKREALRVMGWLGVVSVAVYVLSYARFWSKEALDLGGWLELQRSMLNYHLGGVGGHPYASSSVGWLLLRRPVTYFFAARGNTVQHIVALGNPLLWWAFVATLPWLVRAWLRRSDHAADVVLLGFAATYVPWLLVRRTSFLYYLTPLVPFLAIGVAWALQRLWRSSLSGALRRGAVVTYLLATFLTAALLLPVWIGLPIVHDHWRCLILFPGWK
jgi:dolichyl-phosphate-mannose-protein mannosyltransferase